MATVITHFYNEAKLLPFWLQHHTKMFENGILIDHHSTDDSVEICRRLAPHWTVVQTKLKKFHAIDTDFEVMSYENGISGWKMVLNVTEFLHFPHFSEYLTQAQARGSMVICTRGVVMVDDQPGQELRSDLPLIAQKHYGFIEKKSCRKRFNTRYTTFQKGQPIRFAARERIIHRYPIGAYKPGRHTTFHPVDERPQNAFTLWYGYSPWVN